MSSFQPSISRSESTQNFFFSFSESEKGKFQQHEETISKIAYFPVVGQICVWAYDFYLNEKIRNNDLIDCKISLRKFSLRILDKCQLINVIYAIALTVIWGLSTYVDTGSTNAAYYAMGYKISAFYTLMTLPTELLKLYNKWKLSAECAIRDRDEKEKVHQTDDDIIAEEADHVSEEEVDQTSGDERERETSKKSEDSEIDLATIDTN